MTARDELAEDFNRFLKANYPCTCPAGDDCEGERQEAEELVRKVESRGWTKPRIITTAEELDALPSGSVVVLVDGEPNILHDNGWVLPNGPGGYTSWAVAQGLPGTVVYEPDPS